MTLQNQLLKAKLFGSGMLDREDRYSKVFLTHAPIMITDTNKIVCIPNMKEMTHVGFSAMTSKGKTIGMNTLLGFEHWMLRRHCFILNDFQQETFEFSLPSSNEIFNSNLKLINVEPRGYPMVYIYPSHKELEMGNLEQYFPHIKISLPTKEVIENIDEYYQLDKSKKYITAYKDKLVQCADLQDIEILLEEIIPSQTKFAEMKFKIKTIFQNIFQEQICSSSAPDAPSELTAVNRMREEYNALTILTLMYAGLIPSIQTSKITNQEWFSAYMAYIVDSIYHKKRDDKFFRDIPICMYVPEIDKLWSQTHHGEKIKKKLSLIGTNGRSSGIALRWDAQDYNAVPVSIRNNTKHLFVLRKSSSDEVKGIKRDFGLDAQTEKGILSLNTEPNKGLFECYGLTADKFMLYDLRDGKMSMTDAPQKGRLITPLAAHKTPNKPISEMIR